MLRDIEKKREIYWIFTLTFSLRLPVNETATVATIFYFLGSGVATIDISSIGCYAFFYNYQF